MWAVAVAGGNCYYYLWGGEYYSRGGCCYCDVVMMNDDVDGLRIVWQCFGWSTSHDLKVA